MKNIKYKNAQVSVFIILALIIISVIGIYFILNSNLKNEKEEINPQIQPIYSYVDNCIKKTAEDAVSYVGYTGGYFENPELSTQSHIAYYFDKGENYMPSKEKIEQELGVYMANMLFFCVKDFMDFPDFDIKQGNIKTTAKIEDNKVLFNIEYPLSISKEDKTYYITKFEKEIQVRLNTVYSVIINIIDDHMKNGRDVCISCINNWADENDLYVEMHDYEKDVVIFTVIDRNSKINDDDFRFNFANRY